MIQSYSVLLVCLIKSSFGEMDSCCSKIRVSGNGNTFFNILKRKATLFQHCLVAFGIWELDIALFECKLIRMNPNKRGKCSFKLSRDFYSIKGGY